MDNKLKRDIFFLIALITSFLLLVILSYKTFAQEKEWKYEGKIEEIKGSSEKWKKENFDVKLITTKKLHQLCVNIENREIQIDCIKNNFYVKIFEIKNDSVKKNLTNIYLTEEKIQNLRELSKIRKRKSGYKINLAFEFLLKKLENNNGRIKATN